MNCPLCNNEILPNTVFCISCGKKLSDEVIESALKEKRKNAVSDYTNLWKIAFYSLIFPGLAHIAFLNEKFLGIMIGLIFILFLLLTNWFIGAFYILFPALFLAYFVYTFSPLNAFHIYKKKHTIIDIERFKRNVYTVGYFWFIISSVLFFSTYIYFQNNFVITINTDFYKPLIDSHYRVLGKRPNENERYSRGELIAFWPAKRYNLTILNEFIEKIVGMPGETITIKSDEIRINGKILDKKFRPLNSRALADGRYQGEYRASDNQYLVFLNGHLNGRAVSIPSLIDKSEILGKIDSIVYPLGKRKKIIDATNITEE